MRLPWRWRVWLSRWNLLAACPLIKPHNTQHYPRNLEHLVVVTRKALLKHTDAFGKTSRAIRNLYVIPSPGHPVTKRPILSPSPPTWAQAAKTPSGAFGRYKGRGRTGSVAEQMFSVVSVKCSDWVFIRESSVSTVSTKCEIAILQCQHTQTISGLCFFFIGKDIQVFLVFFRISAFCSWTCWTGIIHTQRSPLFEAVVFASCAFLLNPELPKRRTQIQQGQVHLLYRKIKSPAL